MRFFLVSKMLVSAVAMGWVLVVPIVQGAVSVFRLGLKNRPGSFVRDARKFSWCRLASLTERSQLVKLSLPIDNLCDMVLF
jgi:hypothetical protein